MFPKKGTVLPNSNKGSDQIANYATIVSDALRRDVGDSHRATKTVMRWTGASERTVRNWLTGTKGPSGAHLLMLVRHSETMLEVVLGRAGRDHNIAVARLVAARAGLRELLSCIDQLVGDGQ